MTKTECQTDLLNFLLFLLHLVAVDLVLGDEPRQVVDVLVRLLEQVRQAPVLLLVNQVAVTHLVLLLQTTATHVTSSWSDNNASRRIN